jgi:hypothetical protein
LSWNDELVAITRQLIGDTENPYTFTETRMEEVIATAAQFVNCEVDFDTTYTIDVDATTISPDPTSPRDDLFISLVTLKAACILYRAILRTYASSEGVRVKDGMGEIQVGGRFAAQNDMAKSFCQAYEQAKMDYARGNFAGVKAIFNVASGPNINTYFNRGRGASFY